MFEEGTFVPTAKLTADKQLSIITNYLGTPEAMYNEAGESVWSCELRSYGRVRNFQGEWKGDCPFRYQGQYEDAETGLYYNRFRYYDPDAGNYLSQDPIGLAGNDSTFYAFVHDPNTYVDTFGLLEEGEVAGYGTNPHKGDGLDAHEMLRNSYLKSVGATQSRRGAKGNPAMALSQEVHKEVHREEMRLKMQYGLGKDEYMKRGKLEIRLMNQAMYNILVKKHGLISKEQLRNMRRQTEKYAKKKGCY